MSSKIEITKVCQHCGNEFIAKTTVTKFCSHACAVKNYKQRKKAEKLNKVKTQRHKNQFQFITTS